MKAVSLKSHIGSDGILKIQIPTEEKETDVEIIVFIESKTKEKKIWEKKFLNDTYGCFKDSPIKRLPQGEYPDRDKLA
jgi:hypothetical protein